MGGGCEFTIRCRNGSCEICVGRGRRKEIKVLNDICVLDGYRLSISVLVLYYLPLCIIGRVYNICKVIGGCIF